MDLTKEQKELIKKWILEAIFVNGVDVDDVGTSRVAYNLLCLLENVDSIAKNDEKKPNPDALENDNIYAKYIYDMNKIIRRLCAEAGVTLPEDEDYSY